MSIHRQVLILPSANKHVRHEYTENYQTNLIFNYLLFKERYDLPIILILIPVTRITTNNNDKKKINHRPKKKKKKKFRKLKF